jgi:hypothetical protein
MFVISRMNLYVASFWVLLIALSLLAWLWRDRSLTGAGLFSQPELAVAALCWAAALVTIACKPSTAIRFSYLEPALLLIDLGFFLGLAIIGVRSGKGWVLCAAALQLLSTGAHVARLTTPGMWRLGYQVMEEASSYPVLLLLGVGIWRRRLALKRGAR